MPNGKCSPSAEGMDRASANVAATAATASMSLVMGLSISCGMIPDQKTAKVLQSVAGNLQEKTSIPKRENNPGNGN